MLHTTQAKDFFKQIAAALTLMALLTSLMPMGVFAQEVPAEEPVVNETLLMVNNSGNEPKDPNISVTICHASDSHQNPYVKETPNDGSKVVSGHGGHGGPVWYEGITDDWGDIIPPFIWYEKVGTGQNATWQQREYLGMNWDAAGQAIYRNACKIPEKIADLKILKNVDNDEPNEGSDVTYTLTVYNLGTNDATNVVVTDPLAVGLTYKSSSIAPTLTSPLTWNIPTLANGATWEVDVVVTLGSDTGGESIKNTATVTGGSPKDPDTKNNSDFVVIEPVDVANQIPGCTDVDAKNYSQVANVDNGSCLFELTVKKVIIGNTNATKDQFSFTINGASTTAFDVNGVAVVLLPNGNHSIVEVGKTGFVASYEGCSPAVINGASATCTITNTVEVGESRVCRIGDNLLQNGSFETPTVTGDWGIFNPVANWVISLSNGLELWANGFYGGASQGLQNAELDGNAPTKITQAVATEPGATYELRFDFSARPDADSAANNSVDALVGNVLLMNATADGSDIGVNTWSTHSKTFVATATSTEISFVDKGTADSYGSLIDNTVLCLVSPAPTCEPELNGSWADDVVSFEQGKRKDGSAVLLARSDEADALGAADWTPGEGVDFLSLGFGGVIEFTFGPFVPNVAGNDITVYEATNGTYPAETALVEVSQDGATWFAVGTATNPGASSFDFDSTGLAWIKYVRLTDTSVKASHTNDADGFDLDAVFVAQTVCKEPENPTPKTCSIVSDETTLVNGIASTLTWVHPNWTKELTAGKWIWDSSVEPTIGETATFTKAFNVDNAPTGATLKVAADNRYTVTLNGNPLACDGTGEYNYSSTDTCAAPVVSGVNTLTFVVTNDPYGTSDVQVNPSGLIYELTIDNASCSAVPSGKDTYKIEGRVWHDDDEDGNWDGVEESLIEETPEVPLAGREVRITNGTTNLATTTDANGYYYFEVEAGTWVITEVLPEGWKHTDDESHTVTVPSMSAMDDRPAFLAWLIPTAQAAVMGTYGYYDFGNDIIPTVTNGGSSSGRSGGGSSSTRTSRVLGLSTAAPQPMVLGEQVSVVPAGAPDTGHGGTSPQRTGLEMIHVLYIRREK